MNGVIDNSLVGLALLVSAGYALSSLGPKSLRRRLLEALSRAAARAPDATSATGAAQARFASVASGYPLRGATLRVSVGDFTRAGQVRAASSAFVDVGWAAFLLLPSQAWLQSQVVLHLEPWRTHRLGS